MSSSSSLLRGLLLVLVAASIVCQVCCDVPQLLPKSAFQTNDKELSQRVGNLLTESINSTLLMIQNLEHVLNASAKNILTDNESIVKNQVAQFKSGIARLKRSIDVNDVVDACVNEGHYAELLHQQIIGELNQCTLIVYTELLNIITSAIADAQTFMALPEIVANDILTCGLATECLPKIVADVYYESLQTPSKVLIMAARVQEFSFQSIGSVTRCALDGVSRIVELGFVVAGEVTNCVNHKINGDDQ